MLHNNHAQNNTNDIIAGLVVFLADFIYLLAYINANIENNKCHERSNIAINTPVFSSLKYKYFLQKFNIIDELYLLVYFLLDVILSFLIRTNVEMNNHAITAPKQKYIKKSYTLSLYIFTYNRTINNIVTT